MQSIEYWIDSGEEEHCNKNIAHINIARRERKRQKIYSRIEIYKLQYEQELLH